MAEQFVLKGVNRLVDYKSSGAFTFQIKNDPRGGDTWQIPQWWAKKANNTIYNSCTVLDLVGTNYVAIIPTSVDTQLMVTYDADVYNIGFSNFSAVDRVAITSKDQRKIVVEYLFPSVSGGAIAKRILQAAATIGDFTISGKGSVDVGGTSSYQSNATPDASDAVYAWTVEQGGSAVATSKAEITAGAATTGCTVSWKQAGSYDLKCTITSNTATDSPKSDTKAVTCNVVNTVGTSTISTGSATPEAQKTETYAVTTSNNNVNDLEYLWSVVDANAQVLNKNAASTGITFEAAGNATVQCVVSSPTAADSDSPTKAVVVSSAKAIGTVTVDGEDTPQAGTAANYQASIDGNVADATYQWVVTPADGTFNIGTATTQATNITFNSADSYQVKCTVSSVTAQDSPVPSAPLDVTVGNLGAMPGIMLGGPTDVTEINVGKNYTSATADGSTLAGTNTYRWTAEDADTGETSGIGVTINSPNSQNTSITYSANADGRSIKLHCKWTNTAYSPTTKTGTRAVNVAIA